MKTIGIIIITWLLLISTNSYAQMMTDSLRTDSVHTIEILDD